VVRSPRDDALLVYLSTRWVKLAGEHARTGAAAPLSRKTVQELCYFLKVKGVPMRFRFRLYHYGPYSQPLHYRMADLVAEGYLRDLSEDFQAYSDYRPNGGASQRLLQPYLHFLKGYQRPIDSVVKMLCRLTREEKDLVSTVHYLHESHLRYHGETLSRDAVVEKAHEARGGRGERRLIESAYDALDEAGLLRRSAASPARA